MSVDGTNEAAYSIRGNTLYFAGEVSNKLAAFLWDSLYGKEGRRLFLNSLGGDCESMLSILDLFDSIEDLETIATGACMSAAVPLIASGTPGKRFATPRTRFMVHSIRNNNAETDEVNMEADLHEMQKVRKLYVETLVPVTKKNGAWWTKKLREKPTYFGAEQALEWGIIDGVAE